MNLNLSEIVFILDRSGSMSGLESDTIGGYNGFLARQKAEPGEARITTILFDDQYEVLHDAIDIKSVQSITEREYFTRGSTALLDAVGKTINSVGRRLRDTPEDQRPGKVIFVITTDGLENASREFNYQKIREMITHQRDKYSWEFIFLGANIDAEGVAGQIGIARDRAANYSASPVGTGAMYASMADNVSQLRRHKAMAPDWKDRLSPEQDRQGQQSRPDQPDKPDKKKRKHQP